MYGFCTTMNVFGSSFRRRRAAACEANVLAGVRRSVLNQDARGRNAHADRDPGELIRFRLAPELPGDGAEAARVDQERCPAVEKELRSPLGDGRVMAAQHQDRVGLRELMIHLVIAPDPLHHLAQAWIQLSLRRYDDTLLTIARPS